MKREGIFPKVVQITLLVDMLFFSAALGKESVRQELSLEESMDEAVVSDGSFVAEVVEDAADNVKGIETESVSSTDSSGVKTESAVLTQDEPEFGMQGDMLTYGGLTVVLPKGIEAKWIDAKDSGNIFCIGNFSSDGSKGRILDLCGAQEVYADRVGGDGIKGYLSLPPRVRLLHYTAVYDSEMALLCAFFDLLPEAVGCRMYADQEKNEYAYRLEQDGYLYLFLVKGAEVCLVQEIAAEEDCSFEELLADGMARWQDGGGIVGFREKPDAFTYRRLVPEEGITLLYASEKQGDSANLRLYREGYYEKPWREIPAYIKAEKDIRVEDVNFDGCPDLTGYGGIFLWDRQAKTYMRAQAEIPLYYLYHRQFPETESFWGNSTYGASQNWDSVRQAEAIWQWEGPVLIKKRECVVSYVEEGIKVWAYEDTPEQLLFDETFSRKEWEQEEQGRVLQLYRQFYDGMVPEAVYGVEHRLEGGQTYIPQGLLDEIDGVIAAGEDPVILSKIGDGKESAVLGAACGRELTEEEALALAEQDMAVRQQVQMAARFNYSYTILEADCDNDGTVDLAWQLDGYYIGGMSGNVEYVFLQGQQDGSYAETDSFSESRETFNVISYEGKNYLCYVGYEPAEMIYNGYIVRSYVNGKMVEEARIHEVRDYYESPQIWAEAGYEKLAADMAEKCDALKGQFDEGKLIDGEAERWTNGMPEQPSAYEPVSYKCDLDNDGKEEKYSKWTRELSFFDGGVHLEFRVEADGVDGDDAQGEGNKGLAALVEEMEASTDEPVALWVEEYAGKNIVQVLYLTGLDDYRITGYLVGETDCNRVYEIAVDAVYRVAQEGRIVF